MTRIAPIAEPALPLPGHARRIGTTVLCHPIVDAYAGFVPPLVGVLQVRCDLTALQAASLLSIGSLVSGLCQPAFAWLSDHIDSRLLGSVGLAVAAASLSCIGLADDYASLVTLLVIGMLGVGAFHPVAAAAVGEMAGARRSAAVTAFFVAGMVGATLGPIISTRVTAIEPHGFMTLRWLMIPGLVFAVLLHAAIRKVPHRSAAHPDGALRGRQRSERWFIVAVLFVGNALRYSVNMALVYLFVRLSEHLVRSAHPAFETERVVREGALHTGLMVSMMMFGMGAGAVGVGSVTRRGREKLPVVLVPLLLAPIVFAFPWAGSFTSVVLAVFAGVAYGAIVPLSISLAQRLLPHRTSLASSLMMGAAWSCATVAPPLAQWVWQEWGLTAAFTAVAGVLALSGVIGLPISARVLRELAVH